MLRGKKNWRAFYANKKKEVRRKKIGELSRIDGFIRQQSKNVFFLSNKVIHSFLSLLCLSLDYMFHLFISLMFKLEPGSFLHLCFFSPSVVCVLATALSDEWSPPETTHEKNNTRFQWTENTKQENQMNDIRLFQLFFFATSPSSILSSNSAGAGEIQILNGFLLERMWSKYWIGIKAYWKNKNNNHAALQISHSCYYDNDN